jgi:hypothetical protein
MTDKLIIGAHHANPSGEKKAGKSYVVFGKQDTYPIELSAIATGKGGFVIKGESAGEPNTTYDLPALCAPIIKSSKPSPLTSPALETENLL